MSKNPLTWWIKVMKLMKIRFPTVPIAIMQEDHVDTIYYPERINAAWNHLAAIEEGAYDILFCHNKISEQFYLGLTDKVRLLPTAYPVEMIKKFRIEKPEDKVLVNGSMSRIYNGAVNLYSTFQYKYSVTMADRYTPQKMMFKNTIPVLFWVDWCKAIANHRVAVNVANSIGAGSFNLACACLGIPCIGNHFDHVTNMLYQHMGFAPYNLVDIQMAVDVLMQNEDAWRITREECDLLLYKFTQESVKNTFLKGLQELIGGLYK